jgi:hypothetical protein
VIPCRRFNGGRHRYAASSVADAWTDLTASCAEGRTRRRVYQRSGVGAPPYDLLQVASEASEGEESAVGVRYSTYYTWSLVGSGNA